MCNDSIRKPINIYREKRELQIPLYNSLIVIDTIETEKSEKIEHGDAVVHQRRLGSGANGGFLFHVAAAGGMPRPPL